MERLNVDAPAAWQAQDLARDGSWVFELGAPARRDLERALDGAYDPAKALFDYRRDDFDLGAAAPAIDAALAEAKRGRGIALLRGLPRDGLSEGRYGVLTWALGLHAGVARPQGKRTQYLSEVRNAGTAYRTGTGRGYSSNAELDYHTDSADLVFLSCYNKAASGGMTIVTSSLASYAVMRRESPELADWLHRPLHFSRQGEEAPDEAPSVLQPVFDQADGKLFSRWNWNRVRSAQRLPGVPALEPQHAAALERFDAIVRRPELAYAMWLEPGDVQIVNSHVTLHSRTEFVDHEDPVRKRLLFRLWIAPSDSALLPESWRALYRSVAPGTVRGGIRGHQYDQRCAAFEAQQARDLGMPAPGSATPSYQERSHG